MPGNKSYTLEDLKEPKEGWAYLKKLLGENTRYKIDLVSLAVVCGAWKPEEIREKCTAFLTKGHDAYELPYKNIFYLGNKYGVPPEFLVDESYYRKRSGILGYRIAFSALRRGMTLWDLYLATLKAGWKLSPWTFYALVHGDKRLFRFVDLDTVRGICELAGMELALLFVPQMKASCSTPVARTLASVLAMLTDADLAALGAIAVALAKHKEDTPDLRREIGRVLTWRTSARRKGGELYG